MTSKRLNQSNYQIICKRSRTSYGNGNGNGNPLKRPRQPSSDEEDVARKSKCPRRPIQVEDLDFSRFGFKSYPHRFWDWSTHMLSYCIFLYLDLSTLWNLRRVNRGCLKAVKFYEQQYYGEINRIFKKFNGDSLLANRCSCEQCRWKVMRIWFWKLIHTSYRLDLATWPRVIAQMNGPIGRQLIGLYIRRETIRKQSDVRPDFPVSLTHE